MDYFEDFDDESLTGDETLDYLIYDEIVNGEQGNGCFAVILFLVFLGGLFI